MVERMWARIKTPPYTVEASMGSPDRAPWTELDHPHTTLDAVLHVRLTRVAREFRVGHGEASCG